MATTPCAPGTAVLCPAASGLSVGNKLLPGHSVFSMFFLLAVLLGFHFQFSGILGVQTSPLYSLCCALCMGAEPKPGLEFAGLANHNFLNSPVFKHVL